MPDINELIKIQLQFEQVGDQKTADRIGAQIDSISRRTERLQALQEKAAAQRAAGEIQAAEKTERAIARETAAIERQFRRVQEEAERFSASIADDLLERGRAGFAGLAAGIAAVGAAYIDLARRAAEYNREQIALQRATGASAEFIAGLTEALRRAGGDSGDVADVLLQVGQAATQNSAAFEQIGIAVTDAAGRLRPLEQIFRDIAAAAAGRLSQEQLLQIAQILGEDASKKILPLLGTLERITDETKQAGLVMSDVQARDLAEFSARTAQLEAQLRGAAVTLGADLVPALNALATEIQRAIAAAKTDETLGAAFVTLRDTISGLATLLSTTVGPLFDGISERIKRLGTILFTLQNPVAVFSDLASQTKLTGDLFTDLEAAMVRLTKSQQASTTATTTQTAAVRDAGASLTALRQQLTDATRAQDEQIAAARRAAEQQIALARIRQSEGKQSEEQTAREIEAIQTRLSDEIIRINTSTVDRLKSLKRQGLVVDEELAKAVDKLEQAKTDRLKQEAEIRQSIARRAADAERARIDAAREEFEQAEKLKTARLQEEEKARAELRAALDRADAERAAARERQGRDALRAIQAAADAERASLAGGAQALQQSASFADAFAQSLGAVTASFTDLQSAAQEYSRILGIVGEIQAQYGPGGQFDLQGFAGAVLERAQSSLQQIRDFVANQQTAQIDALEQQIDALASRQAAELDRLATEYAANLSRLSEQARDARREARREREAEIERAADAERRAEEDLANDIARIREQMLDQIAAAEQRFREEDLRAAEALARAKQDLERESARSAIDAELEVLQARRDILDEIAELEARAADQSLSESERRRAREQLAARQEELAKFEQNEARRQERASRKAAAIAAAREQAKSAEELEILLAKIDAEFAAEEELDRALAELGDRATEAEKQRVRDLIEAKKQLRLQELENEQAALDAERAARDAARQAELDAARAAADAEIAERQRVFDAERAARDAALAERLAAIQAALDAELKQTRQQRRALEEEYKTSQAKIIQEGANAAAALRDQIRTVNAAYRDLFTQIESGAVNSLEKLRSLLGAIAQALTGTTPSSSSSNTSNLTRSTTSSSTPPTPTTTSGVGAVSGGGGGSNLTAASSSTVTTNAPLTIATTVNIAGQLTDANARRFVEQIVHEIVARVAREQQGAIAARTPGLRG